jgi:hypothetical protein
VIEGLDIVVTHPDPTGASTFAANVPVICPAWLAADGQGRFRVLVQTFDADAAKPAVRSEDAVAIGLAPLYFLHFLIARGRPSEHPE